MNGRCTEDQNVILQDNILSLQVCVSSTLTDDQVRQFAQEQRPCGTRYGWYIRRAGDPLLAGDPERQPCEEREDAVHIMLDS